MGNYPTSCDNTILIAANKILFGKHYVNVVLKILLDREALDNIFASLSENCTFIGLSTCYYAIIEYVLYL